ncbi:NYN domain-containing protein [Sphingomonas bacterium]|uniref:NYN domain-containing protein n=1 Tax=Sphingomonas bacterium TaxID=1895847 RepID=UPI001575DE2C|nr:NYN domain-containing protein [Sphingomonas bacterium]
MTDISARNVALLIDADNASAATLDPVLTVLAELGTVNVRRVYGNWTKPGLKPWQEMSIKHGIEPQQQFDLTKGKNATDMKMTIDAMDLLFRGRIDGFGIMSSDSDFMPLAMRIRQDGVPVYGFGTSRTPEGFRQACTRFIDVSALDEAEEAAPLPLPPSIGGERTVAPIKAAVRAKQVKEIGPELLKLLIDAYNAVKRDERGYVSLTEMGQLAGNRSSFDARNYGFNRLSDLIETVPNFQTERRDGGRVFVKRLR